MLVTRVTEVKSYMHGARRTAQPSWKICRCFDNCCRSDSGARVMCHRWGRRKPTPLRWWKTSSPPSTTTTPKLLRRSRRTPTQPAPRSSRCSTDWPPSPPTSTSLRSWIWVATPDSSPSTRPGTSAKARTGATSRRARFAIFPSAGGCPGTRQSWFPTSETGAPSRTPAPTQRPRRWSTARAPCS